LSWIVLCLEMNVDFTIYDCKNAKLFVVMGARFCTIDPRQHDQLPSNHAIHCGAS
jgi:hypothetical protein